MRRRPKTPKPGEPLPQPADDSEFEAARDARRALAARLVGAGYDALVKQDGDSAHLRGTRDFLLRKAKTAP